jgi:hypothetical protein
MDARTAAVVACLCFLLVVLTGCPPQTASPTAHQAGEDGSTSAGSGVSPAGTDTGDVQAVSDVEPDLEPVQRWINQIGRVDDLHTRVVRRESDDGINPLSENSYDQSPPTGGAPSENIPDASPDRPSDPAARAQDSDTETEVPPVLGSVSARAGHKPLETTTSTDTASASVNAPAQAAGSPMTIDELTEQWLAQPVDRRLVQILSGKYEEARQPLEMTSAEQQQMATQLVEALIAIREGHGGDPGAEANRVLAQIETLAESLLPLSDLRIPTLALTRAVRGFGRYEAINPPEFIAGHENEFVVYCEVQNFLSRPTDDGSFESLFSLRTTVLNRAGDAVLEINDERIADTCRTRRHDCFIPRLVRLPATLSPGEYVVKTTIIDRIGEKVAERRTTFRIVARS